MLLLLSLKQKSCAKMLSSKQLGHIALVEKCKYEEMKHAGINCCFQTVG